MKRSSLEGFFLFFSITVFNIFAGATKSQSMKKLILLIIILSIYYQASSQDLIVTKDNDSIQCKIQGFNNGRIVYKTFINNSYTKKDLLTSDIYDTKLDFYIQNIKNPEQLSQLHTHKIITQNNDTIFCDLIQRRSNYLIIAEKINGQYIYKGILSLEVEKILRIHKIPKGPKKAFEIGFTYGFGNRLISSSNKLYIGYTPISYNTPLTYGSLLNIYASYYFQYHFGAGLEHSYLHTYYLQDNQNAINILIRFWGLRASYIIYPARKFQIGMHLGIGMTFYNEIQKENKHNITYKSFGNSFGMTLGFDFSYFILKRLGINTKAGILSSLVKNIDSEANGEKITNSIDNKNGINLTHLQFSAGLVFKF